MQFVVTRVSLHDHHFPAADLRQADDNDLIPVLQGGVHGFLFDCCGEEDEHEKELDEDQSQVEDEQEVRSLIVKIFLLFRMPDEFEQERIAGHEEGEDNDKNEEGVVDDFEFQKPEQHDQA